MKRRLALLSVLACLVFAADLAAHDTWLLPDSLRVPVGRHVVLSLTSGEAFPADDFAIDPRRVRTATVRLAGAKATLAPPRTSPMSLRYEWTPRSPGIAGLAVELASKTLTLTPEKVEEYFKDINASMAVRAAWDSVPRPRQWRESYTKHAASFVRVGNPRADSSWSVPLGMEFEIVPEVDPTSLRAGQTLRVRVLRNGTPRANLEVGLQHDGDSHVSFTTTDGAGRASMSVARTGRWLVNVTDLRRTHAAGLEWESDFATLTIAVVR